MKKVSLKSGEQRPVKTKPVLQHEAVECGAASLKIILNFYKRFIPLASIRDACGISRDGVTAKQLKHAAESYNMNVRAYKASTDKLVNRGCFPSIIHWEFNHFLVIEGFDTKYAHLNDPANGRWRISISDFKKSFTGVVLEITPNDKFTQGGTDIGSYFFVPKFIEPFRKEFPLIATLSLAASIPELFIAGATSEFIDSYLGEGRINIGVPIIWITFISTILLATLIVIQKLYIRRIGKSIVKRISILMYVSLFSMPYRYFTQRMRGELSSRLDLGFNICEYGVDGLADFALSLGSGIAAFIAGILISPILALITIFISALNTGFALQVRNKRKDDNYKLAIRQGENGSAGMYMFQCIESIKASGLENESFINWGGSYASVMEETLRLNVANTVVRVISSASGYLLRTIIILAGGILIVKGSITVGELMGFQYIMGMIQEPLDQLIVVTNQLQQLDGEMGRVNDVITEETDPFARGFSPQVFYGIDQKKEIKKLGGKIEIKNLTFQFSKNTEKMFNGLSIKIEPGSHLSIVGASGSGKSTLLKIIAGLYNTYEGSINYDGKSWLDNNPLALSSSMALVAQDTYMLSASLEDNITLWDPSYSKSQIIAALENVLLLNDIGGAGCLGMKIGDGGVSLSGGQKQRVELARALIREPSIILLDEATSALDIHLEKKILKQVKSMNATLITVAHRMYSSEVSDYVLVLDQGQVIEYGSPSSLKEKGGQYNELLAREAAINHDETSTFEEKI